MKLLITIMCLIAATGSCFAQSDLVFYDTDGSLTGSLVQFVEDSSCDNGSTENPLVSCDAIVRQGTSLASVTLTSGEVVSTNLQSDLVFYDADGDRAGSLVQFVEDSSCDNGSTENPLVSCDAIVRQGTYLTHVILTTGEITPAGFRYQSDDCTGQPYMLAAHVGPRGGMLLSKGDPSNPVLVEVEWYPNFTNVILKSYYSYNGLCGYSYKNELAFIPNIVDPAKYGMKVIPYNGFKAIGFQGPLTLVNERPDGMFCDSFESRPTQ